jgi:hypothetical protein
MKSNSIHTKPQQYVCISFYCHACLIICFCNSNIHTYIHTYHSRFIPEGVAEVSQILSQIFHPRFTKIILAMRNTADVTGGKPIAVWSQSISGVSAIIPLVAFYDIHGGKREVLFFYFVPDTTRDTLIINCIVLSCNSNSLSIVLLIEDVCMEYSSSAY